MSIKQCSKCYITKNITEFNTARQCKLGVRPECKICSSKHNSQYYLKNREKILLSTSKYQKENRIAANIRSSKWKKNNRHKCNNQSRKWHAARENRTPKWLSDFDLNTIKLYYEFADYVRKTFNEPVEVDHIIPLHGKIISGLHVPWNLQIMNSVANRQKGNRV